MANTDDSKTRNLAAYLISNVGPGRFPESPETPEITQILENFMKVTKHFTKLKETLTNYCLGKISLKKTVRMKLSVDSWFLNVFYRKNENLEMPEFNRKLPK